MFLFEHHDFELLVNQTATDLKMPFAFVEKDYWVTYVLYRLRNAGVDNFIFKGGTSLTKGWGLLERFSEDIDLLFIPYSISNSKKATQLKRVNKLVSEFQGLKYDSQISSSGGHFRMDCYKYERRSENQLGSIRPFIQLEMGYRGGDSPSDLRSIQSYVGAQLAKAGHANIADDVAPFEIPILDPRRTFVEKLFALHGAFEKGEVEKHVRHYYDIFKLLGMSEVSDFIGSSEYHELKNHVAKMSLEAFPQAAIPTGLDFSKSSAFRVEAGLEKRIDSALRASADLFFVAPPSAGEILKKVSGIIAKA